MKEMDRLKRAFVPASAEFHHHIKHTLDNMEELTMKKTSRRISAVVIALLIVLIASVAFAAAHFGVLDYISHRDNDGNVQVNEDLIPHVQTIDRTIWGEAVTVTLHDTICDGATLSLAWTIENKLPNEDVFVVWHPVIEDGTILLGAGTASQSEILLEGGKAWQGGFSSNLDPMPAGDALHVDLYISILVPQVEVVSFDGLSDTLSEVEAERYAKDMSEALADGKIVREANSFRVAGKTYLENEPMVDELVSLGYMRAVDSFDIPLTIDITSGMTDMLSYLDETTAAVENYQMVLSSMAWAPTTLRYTIDYVFEDISRMESFVKERTALALWPMIDEENRWFGSAETSDPEIFSQAEGTWALRYACNITDIWQMPETINIVAHNAMTHAIYHPDEQLHVKIPKQ